MESSGNNSGSPCPHRYNTRLKVNKNYKSYNEDNNEDDSDMSDNDFIENDSKNNELDIYEYRKFISKMFPSQYMNNKVRDTKHFKRNIKSNKYPNIENYPDTNIIICRSGNSYVNDEHNKDDDSEYINEDYQEESDEEESDEEESDEEESDEEEEYDEESDNDETSYHINKKSKLTNQTIGSSIALNILAKKLIEKEKTKNILESLVRIANTTKLENIKKNAKTKYNVNSRSNIQKRKALEKKKLLEKNAKEFKLLLAGKDNMNDLKYFKNTIEIENQNKLITELKNINESSTVDKPYRILLLESEIPQVFKIAALKKLSVMENMDPSIGEYFKLKNWIDTFMRIPFNKFNNLPFNIDDGIEKCNDYMENAVSTLDKAVFGLNDAKMQIMQIIGQWIVNPSAMGTTIAIKGPPGTGKTTLIKEGISKILNRPFALIALGGATDASVLEGHGYTYEGSTWGKIVDILIQTKSSNPIIYFDELDKVSDTPKGEEIIGILTHLIDSTQNGNFHDKYFSEIDFDLSKATFIFSYNDESRVNPILLDRMYKIGTKGYDLKEKKVIAKDYLIPAIYKQVKFEEDNVIFSDETLDYIIDNLTEKEDGVRNLKRCLEIIFTKLNLFRLMKPESTLFKDEKSLKVEFPFTVTTKIVDQIIKKEKEGPENWKRMYM